MKSQWSLLCLLAPMGHCENTYYVDPACGQQEVDTIKTAIKSVYARADRGVKFLDGTLEPKDPDLAGTVTQLLDVRLEKRENVARILDNVRKMKDNQLLTLDPAVHRPGMSDVVIHCDHKRFENTRATAETLFDPTQNRPIARGSLADGDGCRKGRSGFTGGLLTRAVVLQPSPLGDDDPPSTDYEMYDGGRNQPEVIQLCASTMEDIRDGTKNHGLLSREIIEATIADPRNREDSTDEKKVIDLLATVEHVLLHEFTHLIRNGYTNDGAGEDGGQCYGWILAGTCKNPNHADTVAYVGLVADLRYNDDLRPNYSTRPKGSVVPILPPVAGAPPPPQQPANPADLNP